VREYDFSTADLDEEMLGIETSETDMQAIIDSVANPNTIKEAKNVEDLYDAWMYLVRIDSGSSVLYYARQISGAWNVRKIQSISNLIWKDHILMDLSEDKFFRIDSKIDFFSFDGHIFIADKKNFETALNFRSGMEDNRDQIIEELRGKSVADNPDKIKTFVGNNIRRLRKLSQVKKAGYYRDARYLKQLREVNNKENCNGYSIRDLKQYFPLELHLTTQPKNYVESNYKPVKGHLISIRYERFYKSRSKLLDNKQITAK
jgi:hypothetical protein